jgi:hypothetical protein
VQGRQPAVRAVASRSWPSSAQPHPLSPCRRRSWRPLRAATLISSGRSVPAPCRAGRPRSVPHGAAWRERSPSWLGTPPRAPRWRPTLAEPGATSLSWRPVRQRRPAGRLQRRAASGCRRHRFRTTRSAALATLRRAAAGRRGSRPRPARRALRAPVRATRKLLTLLLPALDT